MLLKFIRISQICFAILKYNQLSIHVKTDDILHSLGLLEGYLALLDMLSLVTQKTFRFVFF